MVQCIFLVYIFCFQCLLLGCGRYTSASFRLRDWRFLYSLRHNCTVIYEVCTQMLYFKGLNCNGIGRWELIITSVKNGPSLLITPLRVF